MKSEIQSILPSNSSKFERNLEISSTFRLEDLKVDFEKLSDPDQCPFEFLPYLAWSVGVEVWDQDFLNVRDQEDLDKRRREVIKMWPKIKRMRGTRASIEEVLRVIGVTPIFKLWFDLGQKSHSFKIILLNSVNMRPVDGRTYKKLKQVIDSLKPLSASYDIDILAKYDFNAVGIISTKMTRVRRMTFGLRNP